MATVSAKVFGHHKKTDGTYNVKICVQHKRVRKYLDTSHFLVKKQLTKDFNIKDPFVADKIESQLRKYRKLISELDDRLEFFTAEGLRDYLVNQNEEIDFLKFCSSHIESLKRGGRIGSANNFRVVRNSLIDYFKREAISIKDVHSNMLASYEKYLRSERTITRVNQNGTTVVTKNNWLRGNCSTFNPKGYYGRDREVYVNNSIILLKVRSAFVIRWDIS